MLTPNRFPLKWLSLIVLQLQVSGELEEPATQISDANQVLSKSSDGSFSFQMNHLTKMNANKTFVGCKFGNDQNNCPLIAVLIVVTVRHRFCKLV